MNAYETSALAAAHAANWTAAQAASATYPQVANASGVTLGTGDTSPADFFWMHVKRFVVQTLAAEEHAADVAARKARLKAKVQELAELADVTIARVDAGETADGPCWTVRKN